MRKSAKAKLAWL